MQTIEMLQAISWISSQYSEKTRKLLFTNELFNRPPEREMALDLLNAAHEVSRVRAVLIAHPLAVQVLEAFGLSDLVDEDWPVTLSSVVGVRDREIDAIQHLHTTLSGIMRNWSTMTSCVRPVQNLTTPPEVVNEEDFDEILTIDIRSEDEISVDSLSKVFTYAHELYEGIAKLMGIEEANQLRVIYVASGSSKRFDLRGAGELIKQAKKCLIELWHEIRYRRIEDARRNNIVVLDNLAILEKIEDKRRKKSLSDDEAKLIRTQVLKAMMGFMDEGALIREIPPVETVENQQLLEERQQKLLSGPPETETNAEAPPKRSRRGSARAQSPTQRRA